MCCHLVQAWYRTVLTDLYQTPDDTDQAPILGQRRHFLATQIAEKLAVLRLRVGQATR